MKELEASTNKEPLKIGGWLILIAIGIVFAPIRIFYSLSVDYPPIFSDGTWEVLTTKGSELYSPVWSVFIIGEIATNLLLAIAGIYMAYLFFTKKFAFPKWFFGLAVTSIVVILVDAYVVSLVIPNTEVFNADTAQELLRSGLALCLWSPYLFLSERSKNTFIKGRS
ncbi:DUF2569 domain-containing protein [Vibrio fluvialis]|nr:DUF2569 domain-containing protein [Vibrio fluvialis]